MTVITDGPERRAWEALGRALPRPAAILAISAHWETNGRIHLTDGDAPRTIHDFGNFPQELFDIRYPAPGSAALVERVEQLVGSERIRRDTNWGFDHGVWGVVLPLFPDADVPLVEMSIDRAMEPAAMVELGRQLAPLRHEGVLLIGSGNVVHNLRLWRQTKGTHPDWAVAFQNRVTRAIEAGDNAALTHFAPGDQAAAAAINSGEHYLPLLPIVGARLPADQFSVFNDTFDGALSMTSYLFGDPALLAAIA